MEHVVSTSSLVSVEDALLSHLKYTPRTVWRWSLLGVFSPGLVAKDLLQLSIERQRMSEWVCLRANPLLNVPFVSVCFDWIRPSHPSASPANTHVKYFTQQLAIWGSRSEKLIRMYGCGLERCELSNLRVKTTITFQLRSPLARLDLIFWESSHRYSRNITWRCM